MTEQNPLIGNFGLPRFADIKPEHVVPAVETMLDSVKQSLKAIEADAQPTWESTGQKLAEIDRQFHSVWGPVAHLIGVKNSEELREAFNKVLPDVVQTGLDIAQSRPVYEALDALANSDSFQELNVAKQRIIENNLKHARLSGIELEGAKRDRFNEISKRLSELSTSFSNNVLDSAKSFQMELTNPDDVTAMPQTFKSLAAKKWSEANPNKKPSTAENGPWLATLDYPSYSAIMQHCPNRSIREHLYRHFITKASSGDFDNQPLIKEILKLRKEKSNLLGFSTFAEMSVYQKMAQDVAAVDNLLQDLFEASHEAGIKEHEELAAYAKANGLEDEMTPWDVTYYSERVREAQYELKDEELRPYFPLPHVLNGLFNLVTEIFDIKVEKSTKNISTWNEDVMFFDIKDSSGKEIAAFFLDPYSRPQDKREGAWMNNCIDRGMHDGQMMNPVAYLVCNFTPPVETTPSLLTFRDVETLFHEFGHGLQHMLTKVDESQAAGISGIEWDAVELPSQFMENWCYHKPTLKDLTKHIVTGEQIPDAMFDKIYEAKNYRAANLMLRQLHFGMIDMELHHRYDFTSNIFDIDARIAKKVLATPTIPEDRFLCSFSHIFAGGYAAGYYSYKWAEVLSADAFSAFEEVGLDNHEAVQETGKRFRNTVLALGGSKPPAEVFMEFRGRPQKIDALLRHSGLAR